MPITLDSVGLFVDGAAVKTIGKETFRVCSALVDDMVTVSNDEVRDAAVAVTRPRETGGCWAGGGAGGRSVRAVAWRSVAPALSIGRCEGGR
jgi:threonine dehydratase